MQVYSNTTLVKVKWEYSGEPYHFRINNSNTTLVVFEYVLDILFGSAKII